MQHGFMTLEWMHRKSSRSELCKFHLLHTCKSRELNQREKRWCHDFLHEIITHHKNNQVKAWFRRKMKGKRDVTSCWFDQKPFNAQLNNLEKHPPFTRRSEQTNIYGVFVIHMKSLMITVFILNCFFFSKQMMQASCFL